MSKQGAFIKEMKARGEGKPGPRERFTWETNMSKPKVDDKFPEMHVADVARKPKASPQTVTPTSDLPLTPNGHIDNAELKTDLAAQLKAARRRR